MVLLRSGAVFWNIKVFDWLQHVEGESRLSYVSNPHVRKNDRSLDSVAIISMIWHTNFLAVFTCSNRYPCFWIKSSLNERWQEGFSIKLVSIYYVYFFWLPPKIYQVWLSQECPFLCLQLDENDVIILARNLEFPATPPQASSLAWGCCDPSAGPDTWPCWTSYSWPQPIDLICPDPSAEPSYPQADRHFRPTWCHLQTSWGSPQAPHPDHW